MKRFEYFLFVYHLLFAGTLIFSFFIFIPFYSFGKDDSFYSSLNAKKITIHGVVTSESNEPLPGATLEVKGTDKGAVTNAQGEYKIEEVSDDAVSTLSSIGYKNRTFTILEQDARNKRSNYRSVVMGKWGYREGKPKTKKIDSILYYIQY